MTSLHGRSSAGRAVRLRYARRLVAVLLPAVLLAAACGSDDDDDGGADTTAAETTAAPDTTEGPTTSASGTTDAPTTTEGSTTTGAPPGPAPAEDVGITDTEIKIAMVADVETPVRPGLFQKSVDAVEAWAEMVNANGGLAGRQVVVETYDSKLDPTASRNAVISACESSFALVGTQAVALSDFSDIEACPNSAGDAIGIPNIAGISFGPLQQCSPATYSHSGNNATLCATLAEPEQTSTAFVGDAQYFLSLEDDLHGIWLFNSDLASAQATQTPTYQAMSEQGIAKDGEGFYGASGQRAAVLRSRRSCSRSIASGRPTCRTVRHRPTWCCSARKQSCRA